MTRRHAGHLYLPGRDATIRWHAVGEGPALVFLPGLSMPALPNFLGIATHPGTRGRRVVMIDYLGSGVSDRCPGHDGAPASHAADVAAVLDHLGLGGVDLFGHSMGGTVGIALAMARPELVARLALAESNVAPGGGEASRAIAEQSRADWLDHGFAAMQADLRAEAIRGSALSDRLYAGWLQADPVTLWANAAALVRLDADLGRGFYDLGLPRAFVYGEKNLPRGGVGVGPDTPDPEALRAAGIAVHVVARAGHSMHITNPEGFAEVIAAIFPL